MSTITGGELLVRTLMKAGVEKMFGIHGAHMETIYQSCLDHELPIVDVRHEVAAGHAAEGYARAGNRLGVALVTAGGGFTNVITSIANAFIDRTPVLYVAGAAALADAETNTLQGGFSQVAVATPITKWAFQITRIEHIPRLVAQAIRIATSGPAGPVLLEIPIDVQMARIEEERIEMPAHVGIDAANAPTQEAVERALDLLTAARRPFILVGGEARRSNAGGELCTFARSRGIPVFSDFDGHGLFPSDDALYGGTTHRLVDYAGDSRPDLVLAIGVRFGLFTFGASDLIVPKAAKCIHVDTDPKEIGRLRNVDVGIVADARQMLRALNAAALHRRWPDFASWRAHVVETRRRRRVRLEQEATTGSPIHPYRAVAAVVDALEEDTTVVADGANTYTWVNEVIRQKLPGTYVTHGHYGSMGIGLGLALGAKAARPDRPLLCFMGDGAVGFTIAEFDTMVRNKLPIVVVVINNRSWGACQQFQEMVSGPERVTCTRLGDAAYEHVAAGFGCHGTLVTELEELAVAVKAAFATGRPACINVIIDYAPMSPETTLLTKSAFS